MNQVTMEKDKELTSLKKKLEGMVKLNQALTTERSELMDKVKNTVFSLLLIIYTKCKFCILGIHACTIHTRDLDIYIFRKPRPPSEGCYCTGSHLIAAKI